MQHMRDNGSVMLGWVEEFLSRPRYRARNRGLCCCQMSVCPSICPSVCHTPLFIRLFFHHLIATPFCFFFHVMLCISAAYAIVRCLSVCLSVCTSRSSFLLKRVTYLQIFFTVGEPRHSSLKIAIFGQYLAFRYNDC